MNPFNYLLSANYRIFWLFLIFSFAIAIIFLILNSALRKIHFSKKLWLHPSALFDYGYFFVIFFIKVLIITPLIFSTSTVALWFNYLLIDTFDYYSSSISYFLVLVFFSFSIFIANDFSRYGLHFLMHKCDFLWHFHKFHHRAKILNPLTFYRIHPLESLLFGVRYSLFIGIVSGIFLYFFAGKISLIEVLGVNILQFIPNLFANLRHSHIPLSFGLLENIFISPRQHQIHHDKRFLNTNFGGVLSVWDKIFDTIKYSNSIKVNQKLKFGL